MSKKIINPSRFNPALRDLIVLFTVIFVLLIFSYFFNVFSFLVKLFQENPASITYIDEILTLLVTLSLGLAVFSWRRWLELKKETTQRIKLQEELINIANTRAETERIISKQLHYEIELHKFQDKAKTDSSVRLKK